MVQMIRPAAKNFEEHAHNIFVPYITSQFHKASRVDLVWDRILTIH